MATYKVLQDIEAEDKFLGPLTLRQFILACICAVTGYLCFFFLTKNLVWLIVPLLPIMLLSGFLAFPWGRDQPTETWLIAKVRFMVKPRRRIWDQTGMKELVTITAPKRVEDQFISDNLSQTEVKSRLKALANTIDSRGWAVKNVNVNLYAQPGYGAPLQSVDRLIDASTLTQQVPNTDVGAADDMMDERNNPTAQNLDRMITTAAQNHRQQTLQQMNDIREHKQPAHNSKKAKSDDGTTPDYWFMEQSKPAPGRKNQSTFGTKTVSPGSHDDSTADQPLTAEEKKLLDDQHKAADEPPVAYGHTPVIQPMGKHKKHAKHTPPAKHHSKPKNTKPAVTPAPDPAIINLAKDDNLSVATLAKEAKQQHEPDVPGGEVVISLH